MDFTKPGIRKSREEIIAEPSSPRGNIGTGESDMIAGTMGVKLLKDPVSKGFFKTIDQKAGASE